MEYEYFGDVKNSAMLAQALKSFDYTTLLGFEPFSRTDMCEEIEALCRKYATPVPGYITDMIEDPNKYTQIAIETGVELRKPLIDEINDEFNLDLKNPAQLRNLVFVNSTSQAVAATIDDEDEFVSAAMQNIVIK